MRNIGFIATVALVCLSSTLAFADSVKVKTRLDHLSGTPLIAVISTVPAEITSITCRSWEMLGTSSWKNHNNFTVPAANPVSVAIMDASGFNGYCQDPKSIVAHTDDGDYIGVLDRGPGNWKDSTKLTIDPSNKAD
jgi:hypothetical protein